MGTIFQLNERVQAINFRALVMESVNETKDSIIELNQSEGLQKGIGSDDNLLSPKYKSPVYADEKQKQNSVPPFGTPDLKKQGFFYRGFYITLGNYSFSIGSNDSKAADVEAKYGKYIYGLSTEGRKKYVPILYRTLYAKLRYATGL